MKNANPRPLLTGRRRYRLYWIITVLALLAWFWALISFGTWFTRHLLL